jgi:tetratricopeptide (TPR) repeat protein
MRRRGARRSLAVLWIFSAAVLGATPSADVLLALNPKPLTEGERLQNAAWCLEAGRAAMNQGALGQALDLLDKCLELNSEESEAHFSKGILFGDERVRLRAQAIAEFQLYLASNPGNGLAHAELGRTYQQKGDIAAAEEQYRLATTRDPSQPDGWYRYGELLIFYTDRVQQGIDLTLRAIARGAADGWPFGNLAQGYVRLGKYPEARTAASKAIALFKAAGMPGEAAQVDRLVQSIKGK